MATMTVFFDHPFWVGVLELHDGRRVRAVRQVFGAEPTDAELYQFLLHRGTELLVRAERAAPASHPSDQRKPVPDHGNDRGNDRGSGRGNPKRLAREAARAAREPRPSTAAQEAMRIDLERRAQVARQRGREQREAAAEQRRAARRAKARARHRGH